MSSEADVRTRWLGHIEALRAILRDPASQDAAFLLEAQGHLQEVEDQADEAHTLLFDGEAFGGDEVEQEQPAAAVRVTAAAVLSLDRDDSLDAVMEWFETLLGQATHPFARAVVETWVAVDDDEDGDGTE